MLSSQGSRCSFYISSLTGPKYLPSMAFCCHFSSKLDTTSFSGVKVRKLRDCNLSSLQRGTGGRSSFNGIVCTVFGATGMVGHGLVNRLGKYGSQIIVPYRSDFGDVIHLRPLADLGQMLFHPFHLQDEDSIRKAVQYSNVVVNLIGRDWESWNFKYNDVHNDGCRRIARICREMGVEKFIHFSALNAAENPVGFVSKKGSEFLRSKWYGEQAVREEFPDAVIFRPADIYGERDRFLRYYGRMWRLLGHTLFLWKKGEGVFKQPVFVDDVTKGVMEAILDPNSPGKVYQAVGPHRYHLPELMDWLYYVMRKDRDTFGYRRRDARYNPVFLLWLLMCDKGYLVTPSKTMMCWDKFEREHVTDVVDSKVYTLEDLGVRLTKLEDVVVSLTYWLQAFSYYEEEPNEYPDIPPPPVYNK